MTTQRIHPFDLYEKSYHLTVEDLLMSDANGIITVDGVRYIEDTSLPYCKETAAKNGLLATRGENECRIKINK